MVEVLRTVAEVCLWGLIALVAASLFGIGLWCAVSVIRGLRKGRR